jgi:hypothetical protein
VPKSSPLGVVPRGYAKKFARSAMPGWFLPGSAVDYEVAFASEVFLEMFDTSGRQLLYGSRGTKAKGNHSLDWNREVGSRIKLGSTPYLIRLKAVDGFKHTDYLKIAGGSGSR